MPGLEPDSVEMEVADNLNPLADQDRVYCQRMLQLLDEQVYCAVRRTRMQRETTEAVTLSSLCDSLR